MKWLSLLIAFLMVSGVQSWAQDKKAIVLTVDNETVSVEEFENIFRKNNRDTIVTAASLDEYMELFINFKLKVLEAKELGLDTIAKFRNELMGYRNQLARPYFTDESKLDELVHEAYERKKEEILASHILISCEPSASAADTANAWTRINQVRARLLNGEDFVTLAKESSEDPSAKQNGGSLGYFTVFQMVYPFENAAYNTPVGSVSKPVRTRYGYHVIRVEDRRPARGEILAAHIMVKEKSEDGGAANAETKINEIYEKLRSGEKFEDLAAKYSEDGSTAKKGGELPWFGTNKMVTEFEEAAFALKSDGDFSRPFKTSYGWHIVKRLSYKNIPSFEEAEKELRNKVSRDVRAEKTRSSFLEKLKKEYNYSIDQKIVDLLIAKADTGVYGGRLKVKKGVLKKRLCTVDGNDYLVKDFAEYLKTKANTRTKMTPQEFMKAELDNYTVDRLIKYEDSRLEEKHDAFRLLVNEYRDGILLFELTDQKVWSRAVKDSAGLEEFYQKNQSLFMWPERLDAVIYTCATPEIAKKVRELIISGMDKADIAAEINQDTQLNLEIQEGLYSREDKDILNQIAWTKGLSNNVQVNGQTFIVDVKSVLPPAPRKLSEARGMVTSEYQNYLEKEWINELRKKHTYQVNREVLHSIH